MTLRELRDKYLRFFESKGHLRFPGGSLVPYDVTGRLDESLLFNGAGMVQFKPYFRGIAQPENKRLMTVQKCVRTGDIEEVGDDTHLTFFEMLGNFSFGDYFKEGAIALSWEFMTSPEWLNLDPRKLSFSIFEIDDEAYAEWAKWIAPTGLDPATRIVRLDEASNYWPASSYTYGPPGPCGPNSEMFYWVSDEPPPNGPYTKEDWQRDEAAGKWLEFWNDVFITYEWQGRHRDPANPKLGYVKEAMPELPFRSIDTGFGLERSTVVLGGYDSVYDTDVFEPIFKVIDGLAPTPKAPADQVLIARRVIADHIRTAVFCIAEGVLPGTTGRGYVVRRLIRRAVLKGQRVLGIDKPFFHLVFEGLVESMGDFYTELFDGRATISEALKGEEALFRRTLSAGTQLLQSELDALSAKHKGKTLPGEVAFKLYDTFGFPLEITQEIAAEQSIGIDLDGYEMALKDAQDRSRGSQDRESVYGGVISGDEVAVADAPATTEFVGYGCTEAAARIVRVKPSGGRLRIALDRTPFYAESGGQTGDQGTLVGEGFSLSVVDATKHVGTFWHEVESTLAPESLVGKAITAKVTDARRARILRNHTATHLLQAALRKVLGTHVTQAGSYVGPDNLRFDFTNPSAMTEEQKAKVERIVNEQALANTEVTTYVDLPIAEAKAKGAMALFGEKYGASVRMVEIGEFSRELCGGTHVRSTGEIGLFKIVSESSAASGVRRIEAVTGEAAYQWVVDETQRVKEAAELLKSNPKDLVQAVERVVDQAKEERRKREKAEMSALSHNGSGSATKQDLVDIKGLQLWTPKYSDMDQKLVAASIDERAAGNPKLVAVAALTADGKVTFIAKVGAEAVARGAHAGNIVREVAKIAGGAGGGRPDFATAGGKLPENTDQALAIVAGLIEAALK